MKRLILSLLVALVYSICLNAQCINGVVFSNDSVPALCATVSLLQANDSAFIAGVISNEDGTFSFYDSPKNKLVRVSCVGYKTIVLPASDSMIVKLEPLGYNLDEVVVTSVRPTFKMSQGMFVSNIHGTMFGNLGQATDVLQQMPMMSSDGKSVLGRGTPVVYINNKLMRSWNELKRIPSNMIKEIKFDMNPGAKFSSDVRAVLYITTLKPVGEGFGGTLIMKESVSSCWDTEGWLDLNYRRKGLDVFASSSLNTFSNSHHKRQDTYRFLYNGKSVDASYSGDGYNSSRNGTFSAGFNYQKDDNLSFGATYYFYRVFAASSSQKYKNQVQGEYFPAEFETSVHGSSQRGIHNVSVYFEDMFSEKLTLNVDGNYVHNTSDGKQNIVDAHANSSTELIPVSETYSDMGALKAMLTHSLGKAKLEYGFETTYTRFHQNYDIENEDYAGVLKSNDNESRQTAANIFANYSQNFGKFYTRLGIKYEYANYDYYANNHLLSESSRTYHRLLPSASLSYDISGLSLILDYSIYTFRPTYSQLDDGLQYVSDFRYDEGNSMLKATYNHEFSLNGSYRNFQFVGNYTYKKYAIVTTFDVMEQTPAVLSSNVNHSYSTMYTSLSYSPTFFKIWKPTWTLWAYKQWLTYNSVNYNHPQCGLQWKNLLVLPHNWSIVLNADGNLKGHADTYMARASLRMNFTIEKKMDNWRAKLSILNVFNAKEKGYSQFEKAYTSHYVDYRNPTIALTLSYSLNPAESKYKGGTAGRSELNRLY